jgi:hypothetical protein
MMPELERTAQAAFNERMRRRGAAVTSVSPDALLAMVFDEIERGRKEQAREERRRLLGAVLGLVLAVGIVLVLG